MYNVIRTRSFFFNLFFFLFSPLTANPLSSQSFWDYNHHTHTHLFFISQWISEYRLNIVWNAEGKLETTTTTTPSGILAAFAILLDTTCHNHTHLEKRCFSKNLTTSASFFVYWRKKKTRFFSFQTIRAFVVRNNSCTTKRMGRRKKSVQTNGNGMETMQNRPRSRLANLHFLPSLFLLPSSASTSTSWCLVFRLQPRCKPTGDFRKGPVAQIVLLFKIS